jgi:hypothetical protein
MTAERVPDKQSLSTEERSSENPVQVVERQFIVHPYGPFPAELEFTFEFLLRRRDVLALLPIHQNERFELFAVRARR